MLRTFGICTLTFFLATLVAQVVRADSELPHPGYLDDVREERYQVTREVVIVPPSNPEEARLVDRIFTEKMSKEFSREFRDRFGHTEFEQLEFTTNRAAEPMDSGRTIPQQEYVDKQEEFGQYMAKELIEYHVDQYLKGNRSTRTVYKVKETISNVEVATESGYKFKFRYKLASNKITLNMIRPNERFHKQVDFKGENATVRLAYDVNKTVRIGTDYAVQDEILAVRGEKRLAANLITSITGQSYQKDVGDTPKQDRILLGLHWAD